jgi:hypothetical protein
VRIAIIREVLVKLMLNRDIRSIMKSVMSTLKPIAMINLSKILRVFLPKKAKRSKYPGRNRTRDIAKKNINCA